MSWIAVRPRLLAVLAVALTMLVGAAPPPAQAIETAAREAYIIDVATGTVLLEKNAHDRMPTASMSKIMTMYMLFEAIADGRLALDDTLPVSEYAWRKGGSKMFVEVGDRVRVEDLIRGVIIQSGNDASIVVAEGLAGTEAAFAQRMTERAAELGMRNSNFANATGWPDPNHWSTAADLALLAQRLIDDFPDFYHFYSETEFTYADIRQANRNPLLYRNVGADGLKTGHTEEAGYGLTASAVQDGRRIVMVINGLPSAQARSEEAERLIEWAFREFDTVDLFDAGETVTEIAAWQGAPATIPLVSQDDVVVSIRAADRDLMTVTVETLEPIAAPVPAGTPLGTLVISVPEMPPIERPLVAGIDVARQGFLGRVASGVQHVVGTALP